MYLFANYYVTYTGHCTYIIDSIGGKLVPSEDPMEEGFWIDLATIMAFITGAAHPPPCGFTDQPQIDFETRPERKLPYASTCGPTLYLPLVLNNPEDLTYQMDFAICGCHGFGKL